jgi:hypothetical protein
MAINRWRQAITYIDCGSRGDSEKLERREGGREEGLVEVCPVRRQPQVNASKQSQREEAGGSGELFLLIPFLSLWGYWTSKCCRCRESGRAVFRVANG